MIRNNNGKTLIEQIVGNGGVEFRDYEALSRSRKMEIFVETCRRVMIYLWLNNVTKSVWTEADKKALEIADELGYFPNRIVFKSKNQADKVVAVISVVNNDLKNALQVTYRLKANDPETEAKYTQILNDELATVEDYMNRRLPVNLFIKSFFDVLNANRVCFVSGNDALIMKRILEKAPKYFPDFKALSYKRKISILRDAYRNAMMESRNMRDKYTFARATFEEFVRNNLVTRVYNHYFITGKFKMFRKIGYSANTIKTQKGYLPRFIEFEYDAGDSVLRTSFGSYDLWELLAKGDVAT